MRPFYTYENIQDTLQKAVVRIRDFNKVPDDLFILKPGPGKWSADEVCRHLIQFNNLYINQMDHVFKQLVTKPVANSSFRTGYISHFLIRFIEPPYKFKLKTLAPMYPAESNQTPDEVRNALSGTMQKLQNQVSEYMAVDLDLNQVKGRNPVFRFLPMSMLEFILYLEAHQRRHFWQIEQTLYKLSGERY